MAIITVAITSSGGTEILETEIGVELQTSETVSVVDGLSVSLDRIHAEWLTYQENTEVWTDRTEPGGPLHEPPEEQEGGSGAIAYHASYHLIYYLVDPWGDNKPEFWIHKRMNNAWRMLQPQVFGTPEVDYPTWGSKDEAVASCWDGNNDRVLIYARRYSDDAPDLWGWNQATFTRLTGSVTGLPTIIEPQMVWDSDNELIWLYGYDSSALTYKLFQLDTDTLTFTDKTIGGTEGVDYPPGRRRGCGFAYDPNLQEVVLSHGGITTLRADTWSCDGIRWMNQTPVPGTEGSTYPSARTRCSLVTGPTGDLYMVGGRNASDVALYDTWRWLGAMRRWERKPDTTTSVQKLRSNMRSCGRWPVVCKKCQPPITYDFEFRSNEVVNVVDAVVMEGP